MKCDSVIEKSSLNVENDFTPLSPKSSYLNFHPLEVVSRYGELQLLVGENYSDLFNLRPNINLQT